MYIQNRLGTSKIRDCSPHKFLRKLNENSHAPGCFAFNVSLEEIVQETDLTKQKKIIHYDEKNNLKNDGGPYQFIDEGKADRNVISEQVTLTFPEDSRSLFPK